MQVLFLPLCLLFLCSCLRDDSKEPGEFIFEAQIIEGKNLGTAPESEFQDGNGVTVKIFSVRVLKDGTASYEKHGCAYSCDIPGWEGGEVFDFYESLKISDLSVDSGLASCSFDFDIYKIESWEERELEGKLYDVPVLNTGSFAGRANFFIGPAWTVMGGVEKSALKHGEKNVLTVQKRIFKCRLLRDVSGFELKFIKKASFSKGYEGYDPALPGYHLTGDIAGISLKFNGAVLPKNFTLALSTSPGMPPNLSNFTLSSSDKTVIAIPKSPILELRDSAGKTLHGEKTSEYFEFKAVGREVHVIFLPKACELLKKECHISWIDWYR